MKIELRQEEYGLLLGLLKHVDGRSYDPVYKNILERIEKTSASRNADMIVTLEESETYNVLDAVNEYIDEAEKGNYSDDARKERISEAQELMDIISEETGLRV